MFRQYRFLEVCIQLKSENNISFKQYLSNTGYVLDSMYPKLLKGKNLLNWGLSPRRWYFKQVLKKKFWNTLKCVN